MKCILLVLLASSTITLSRCNMCNFTTFHLHANACLAASNVPAGTEFLFPVLEDDTAVINFCTRTLTDIKTCIQHTISDCIHSNIRTIFGLHGSHLLSAYSGLCAETTKAETLTCAYHHRSYISSAVSALAETLDELTYANKFNICAPLHTFRKQVLMFVEDAVHTNHCHIGNHMILSRFLDTVEFKCLDVATPYYPCTASRINSDAVACFAASSVTVKNAIIPAPGLAHADVMCSSKDTILNCIHSHLGRCIGEEQVSILGKGKEYAAAYNCMCELHNADMVLSCPSTADISTHVRKFLSDLHTSEMAGDLNHETLCSKMMVIKSRVINAINSECTDQSDRMYWQAFLSTIVYPCTEKATLCYPHMGSGSDPNMSVTAAVFVMLFRLFILAKDFFSS